MCAGGFSGGPAPSHLVRAMHSAHAPYKLAVPHPSDPAHPPRRGAPRLQVGVADGSTRRADAREHRYGGMSRDAARHGDGAGHDGRQGLLRGPHRRGWRRRRGARRADGRRTRTRTSEEEARGATVFPARPSARFRRRRVRGGGRAVRQGMRRAARAHPHAHTRRGTARLDGGAVPSARHGPQPDFAVAESDGASGWGAAGAGQGCRLGVWARGADWSPIWRGPGGPGLTPAQGPVLAYYA